MRLVSAKSTSWAVLLKDAVYVLVLCDRHLPFRFPVPLFNGFISKSITISAAVAAHTVLLSWLLRLAGVGIVFIHRPQDDLLHLPGA